VPWALDIALAACAALAIEGDWLHRLFPPLILLAVLHGARPRLWHNAASLLGDRALLALAFALAAAFSLAEPAVMLAALLVLLLDATVFRAMSRITPA
jgi:hypothetical protein